MQTRKKFLSRPINWLISLKAGWLLALYVILNGLSTGMGMGVPFFNILLGLPTGWVISLRLIHDYQFGKKLLGKTLFWSALSAGLTVIFMLIIWGPAFPRLAGTDADLVNFGIPMVLYEPRASFIGWMVLMILISPVLQMLVCLFAAIWTIYQRLPKDS